MVSYNLITIRKINSFFQKKYTTTKNKIPKKTILFHKNKLLKQYVFFNQI